MEDNMQGSQAGSTNRNECSPRLEGQLRGKMRGRGAASSSVLERGEINKCKQIHLLPSRLPPNLLANFICRKKGLVCLKSGRYVVEERVGRVLCAEETYIVKRLKASLVEPPPPPPRAHTCFPHGVYRKSTNNRAFPPSNKERTAVACLRKAYTLFQKNGYIILF